MRSTFHGLETARRAIQAQQYALHTIGHNVANVGTEGYSRQRVNLGTMTPLDPLAANRSAIPGQMGTGVIVRDIVRLREEYLDSQFRHEYGRLGEWDVRLDALEKLESMFHEPSDDGLAAIMDEFWAAWHTLSEDPGKSTSRVVVIEKMKTMVEAFNIRAGQLDDLQADLTKNLDVKYGRANDLLEQIAELNGQIAKIESTGDNANDLRDARDLLVDDLSRLVDIRVQENSNGEYTITLENDDSVIVNGKEFTLLEKDVQEVGGGEIGGLIQSLEQVDQYRKELDTMVRTLVKGRVEVTLPEGTVLAEDFTFINEDGQEITVPAGKLDEPQNVIVEGVNGLHELGWDSQDPPQTGGPLFISTDGGEITAGNIRVSDDLLNDESLLAPANSIGDDGSPLESSNGIARLMAKLKENGKFEFGTEDSTISRGTIGDYYNAYSSKVGIQTESAQNKLNNQLEIVKTIDMRRQSVSAVSLDEEMTNMIMFQHAYNAAARNITAIDEMLDRIINGMGHVGR